MGRDPFSEDRPLPALPALTLSEGRPDGLLTGKQRMYDCRCELDCGGSLSFEDSAKVRLAGRASASNQDTNQKLGAVGWRSVACCIVRHHNAPSHEIIA